MISYLQGHVKFKTDTYLIVFVNGIGFKVHVPIDIISKAEIDKPMTFFTFTYFKEEALELYGFKNQEELVLFELFLKVSGIGPKTALSIFSAGKIEKIKEAIVKGDVDFFTTVPRLGRKNAQKIIIELRPKMGSLSDLDMTSDGNETKEIIDALKSFGFNTGEAKEAIKSTKDIKGNTSDKIRQALKFLGKK